MPSARVGAVIRLKEDVPTLALRCDDKGVVVSVWLSPGEFLYEVKFLKPRGAPCVRALLRAEQLQVVE